jgi:ABC-type uncharacterized transport system involved in gliding motility auxiliary subunit
VCGSLVPFAAFVLSAVRTIANALDIDVFDITKQAARFKAAQAKASAAGGKAKEKKAAPPTPSSTTKRGGGAAAIPSPAPVAAEAVPAQAKGRKRAGSASPAAKRR